MSVKEIKTLKIEFSKNDDIIIKVFNEKQMKEYLKLKDKSEASDGLMLELNNIIHGFKKIDYDNKGEQIIEKIVDIMCKYPELGED